MIDLLLVSSTYRHLHFNRLWSASARQAIPRVSGVEPTLFLAPRMIDWTTLQLRPESVDAFFNTIFLTGAPLTNGRHGVRVHGFTDFGRRGNSIRYAENEKASVALLKEQIILTSRLAEEAGVDTTKYHSLFVIHLGRSGGKRKEELGRLVRVMRQVEPVAAEHKVVIGIENVFDAMKGYSLGSEFSDIAEIVHAVDSPFVGVTFDFAHALIHYRGDYDKIRQEIKKYDLLKHIAHLHLTAPAPHYVKKFDSIPKINNLLSAKGMYYLAFRNPDAQSGFSKFFAAHPEEQQQLLDLTAFVAKNSLVSKEHLHCATVELTFNVHGTDIGASASDIFFTIRQLEAIL